VACSSLKEIVLNFSFIMMYSPIDVRQMFSNTLGHGLL
jgi:hypothetical protein